MAEGNCVISEDGTWMNGSYESVEAASLAYALTPEELHRLQKDAIPGDVSFWAVWKCLENRKGLCNLGGVSSEFVEGVCCAIQGLMPEALLNEKVATVMQMSNGQANPNIVREYFSKNDG